jgi:hypothetical protein
MTERVIKVGLAMLLLGCLADMSYGYYQLVRFIGMISFGVLAFQERNRGSDGFFIFWLGSAILINPIFKISLGRELWNIVDVIWAVILLITAFNNKTEIK